MINYELWNFTAFSGVDIVWHAKIRCSNCKVQPAVLFSWSHEIVPLISFDILWLVWGLIDFDRSGKKVISGIGGSLMIPDDPWGSVLQSPALSSARPSVAALHQQMPRLVADWHSFFEWGTNHGWFLVDSWLVWGPTNWWYCATNYWIHKKHFFGVPLTSLNIKHSNLGAPCLQTITIRDTTQTIDKPPDQAHLRP